MARTQHAPCRRPPPSPRLRAAWRPCAYGLLLVARTRFPLRRSQRSQRQRRRNPKTARRRTLLALQRVRVAHVAVSGRLHTVAKRVEGVVLLVEDEGADVRVLGACAPRQRLRVAVAARALTSTNPVGWFRWPAAKPSARYGWAGPATGACKSSNRGLWNTMCFVGSVPRGAAVTRASGTATRVALARLRAKQRTEQVLGGCNWNNDASPGWPASAHERQACGVHGGRNVRHPAAQRRHVLIAAVASKSVHLAAPRTRRGSGWR